MGKFKKQRCNKKDKLNENDENLDNIKYGIFSNIIFIYKIAFKYGKNVKFLLFLNITMNVAVMSFNIFIPSAAVYILENNMGFDIFLFCMCGIILLYGICSICHIYSENYFGEILVVRIGDCCKLLMKKALSSDYAIWESHKTRKIVDMAANALGGNERGVELVYRQFPNAVFHLIGLIVYGSAVFMVDIRILAILLFMLLFNIITNRYARNYLNSVMEESATLSRKCWYLNKHTYNIESGKDIRMYHMERWFGNIMNSYVKQECEWQKNVEKKFYLPVFSDTVFIAIRDFVCYSILIYMVLNGSISLAGFTLMIGVVSSFSDWLFGFTNSCTSIIEANKPVSYFRYVLNIKNNFKREEGLSLQDVNKRLGKDVLHVGADIEFREVSFQYDEENIVLSHINFHIKSGEKIAIVGGNGAGKTTLVKLLCGFYHPTSGQILINGISIEDYNIDEYYNLIAAVFQEIDIMSLSIINIVTGGSKENADMNKFTDAIKRAGIYDKIQTLDYKEDTYIDPVFDDNGINLSGGEIQKLMLARSIYKDANILILDEPTSALDPIAESEMYNQYSIMSTEKTSIFISHRLASTRFCDKIFFLENGKIIEEGTHENLVAKHGRYAHIYEIQSHYYKDNAKKMTIADMEAAYD